ncbi:MAG: LamG domain-containing protein, partial [Planctomycetota bacterium]
MANQPSLERSRISEDMPPGEASLFDGRNLGQWKIADFGGQGNVHVKDESIMLQTGDTLTGVTWTGPVLRMNYEINLDAMRVDGDDFFCGLTFPVGDSCVTFVVGGWG